MNSANVKIADTATRLVSTCPFRVLLCLSPSSLFGVYVCVYVSLGTRDQGTRCLQACAPS